MADGPDYFKLFTDMKCLNVETNKKEIVQNLRFHKGEGHYQAYLAHYLPMLAKPEHKEEFDEFIGDLENEDLVKRLKDELKSGKEEVTETVSTVADPTVEVPVLKTPKKFGRKSKNS